MPYADPDQQRAFQARWIQRRRQEFLIGKSCVKCGATEDLEVDHVDPAKKITHRIWSWSQEKRNVELAKCQILCLKCHREKTRAASMTKDHGTSAMYRRGCRCEPCREIKRRYDRASGRRRQERLRAARLGLGPSFPASKAE